MSYYGYEFRCSRRLAFATALNISLVKMGWVLHDTITGVKASRILTLTGNALNNETLTVGSKTYTFKTTLTPTEGEILISTTAALTIVNIQSAVNHTGNPGTDYYCAAAHPQVSVTSVGSTTATFTSLLTGEIGNSYVCTETMSNGSFPTGNLIGGTNDIFVYKSNGESGAEPYGYVWIDNNTTSNWIEIVTYQYWDNSSHIGYRKAYNNGNDSYRRISSFSSSNDCFIGGDKNLVVATSYMSSGLSYSTTQIFGHLPGRTNSTLATLTSPATSGTNVTLQVSSTSGFGAGEYIQILGTTEGCDRIAILSITDSYNMVVSNLPRNYASGSFIGTPASVFGWKYIASGIFAPNCYHSDSGVTVSNSSYNMASISANTGILAFTNQVMLMPHLVGTNLFANPGFIHKYFLSANAATTFDALIANNDNSISPTSTVTSSTNLTLVDSTKSWTENSLTGKFIVIVTGTGIGQCRKILSNTSNTLTINLDWYINPDSSSDYKIVDIVYRYNGAGLTGGTAFFVTHTETPT